MEARRRVRTIGPVEAGPAPTKAWRAPFTVSEAADPRDLVVLGEIDPARPPGLWAGWPNGSCFQGLGGKTHKGRHLLTPSGKVHVLRWNGFTKSYVYAGLKASSSAA